MSTLVERLEALAAKWRKAAVDWRNCGCEARAYANEQHADELDALRATTGEGELTGPWVHDKPSAAAPPPPLRDAGAVATVSSDTTLAVVTAEGLEPETPLFAHPAPAQVDETRVLAALGHEPQVSDNCTARVIPTPSDKPGPRDPPIWCHLKAGHDGPHRCNHGGGYRSFPFRKSDPVEFREPVTICAKCRTRWPCPEAEKVSAALAAAAKEVPGG